MRISAIVITNKYIQPHFKILDRNLLINLCRPPSLHSKVVFQHFLRNTILLQPLFPTQAVEEAGRGERKMVAVRRVVSTARLGGGEKNIRQKKCIRSYLKMYLASLVSTQYHLIIYTVTAYNFNHPVIKY